MEVGEAIVSQQEKDAELEQAWLARRRGMLTCSMFSCLIGTGRGKNDVFTGTGYSYLKLKIAERLGSWHEFKAASTEWGKNHEAAAIEAYHLRSNLFVNNEPYQFIKYNDDVGGTPDGIVEPSGCVEAKVPYNPAVHVNTLINREVPKEYYWQVHGHMLVTGADWCDFISFDPRIETKERLVVIRVERNENELAILSDRLENAAAWINRQMKKIQSAA